MKTKKGFELRDVCGENVIIAEGIENIDFTKLINLNETAAFLWKKASERTSFTADELAADLVDAYEVTPEVARKDVDKLLAQWNGFGLLEDCGDETTKVG